MTDHERVESICAGMTRDGWVWTGDRYWVPTARRDDDYGVDVGADDGVVHLAVVDVACGQPYNYDDERSYTLARHTDQEIAEYIGRAIDAAEKRNDAR